MAAAADAGQTVVAAIMGLGAAGVAGGVIAMAWSLHMHQLQLAGRDASGPDELADNALPVPAMNGRVSDEAKAAVDDRGPRPPGGDTRQSRAAEALRSAASSAIEGPDSVIIGEQARYRVHRSSKQQVVSWTAGGGAVSQASDPAHPDDLLLVADRPGNLTVSVRLREGLAERRETKAVTAVQNPESTTPAMASRLLLQDWPLITVAVLVVGFAAALVAVGTFPVGDFIALVAPLTAVLAVVAATRGSGGSPARLGPSPRQCRRSASRCGCGPSVGSTDRPRQLPDTYSERLAGSRSSASSLRRGGSGPWLGALARATCTASAGVAAKTSCRSRRFCWETW